MDETTTLYSNPQSRGLTAQWMLEETGIPYRTEMLGFGPAMKSAAYRAINPMGKVPALVHRGVVVTEVAAILAYLADAVPEAGLAPAPEHRGAYYRWLFFTAGPLEAAMTNQVLGVEVPEAQRGMVGYGSAREAIDAIEGAVAGRSFIAGERFSAADVMVGAALGYYMAFGLLEKRPAFQAYVAGFAARPAFQRTVGTMGGGG